MLKEFFTAALGMQNQQTRLEVTANNMANANTTGFKRSEVFERNLIDARANFYNTKGDVEQNDPPVGSYVVYEGGSYQKTDNPLDLAIQDKGFFVVQDAEGKEFLTKAGHFTISNEGEIIATDGKKLMGSTGVLTVPTDLMTGAGSQDATALNVKIEENGEVAVNGQQIGNLLIADVEDKNELQRISNQDFIATQQSEIKFLDKGQVNVKQGWLEGSNVNIIKEMVSMIELQRTFEAGSKVIQTNDTTLDKSIQLGKYA